MNNGYFVFSNGDGHSHLLCMDGNRDLQSAKIAALENILSQREAALGAALQEIEQHRQVNRALAKTIQHQDVETKMVKARASAVFPLAADENEALQGKADEVIKGILGGKLPARKVDEIGDAVGKAKADRNVGRAIRGSGMQIGLVTDIG
jgi:hypothetical protein